MTTPGRQRTRPGSQRLGSAGTAARQASLREHNLALLLRHVAAATYASTATRPSAVTPSSAATRPSAAAPTAHPAGAPSSAGNPPSRADLAAATGLTRATVSALVDDLLAGGLLAEVGPAPRTGAGRPATGLTLATNGLAGLGLEINVDYLAACVVDLSGAVRHRAVRHADLRPVPAETALDRIADLAAEAREAAGRQGLRLAGAALAVPGLVTRDGVVRLAPNLGWREVDAAALLTSDPRVTGAAMAPGDTARLAAPGGGTARPAPPDSAHQPILLVENEANLAAIGESQLAGPTPASFLYVSGEIGIGAGIVLEGTLFRGARGWSGELGHVPVRPDGPICRCGARGCLEQYAGQEAILTAVGLTGSPAVGLTGSPTSLAGPPGRPAGSAGGRPGGRPAGAGPDEQSGPVGAALARLVELARAGDPATRRALTDAATALGVAIAGVINMLDVDTVVLGGAYAPLAPWLVPPATEELHRRVLTARWAPVTLRPSALGGDAAMYGAAGSVIRTVLERPAPWLGSSVNSR